MLLMVSLFFMRAECVSSLMGEPGPDHCLLVFSEVLVTTAPSSQESTAPEELRSVIAKVLGEYFASNDLSQYL